MVLWPRDSLGINDGQFLWAARAWPTCAAVATWLQSLDCNYKTEVAFLRATLGRSFSIENIATAEVQHWLRESWRMMKWSMFVHSGRRDAIDLNEAAYNATVRKATMADSHGRAVLSGAACSDAMFQITGDNARKNFVLGAVEMFVLLGTAVCSLRCKQTTRAYFSSSCQVWMASGLPHVRAKLAASRRPAVGGSVRLCHPSMKPAVSWR